MKRLSARTRLLLLQLAAFFGSVGAFLLAFASHSESALVAAFGVVPPGTLIAGIVLVVIGCRRLERKGLSRLRFVVALVVALIKWVLLWEVLWMVLVMAILCARPGAHPLILGLGILWAPLLAVFSVGSQAYFGIGKFLARLSFIDRTRALLAEQRDISLGRAAHPDQLDRAEQLLHVKLPKSYREFLRTFGELRSPSIKCLGITPTVDLAHPTADDCVGATLEGRERFGLPPSYILCSVDEHGQLVCLDTFEMRGEEGPAIAWSAEGRCQGQYLAGSFAEYLVVRLGGQAGEFKR
jgi:hypothetical protein